MYFSPQITDTAIQLQVYDDTGAVVSDFAATGITSLTVGYYESGTYVPTQVLTALITTVNPSTFDIANLFCQIVTSTTDDILSVTDLVDFTVLTYTLKYELEKVPVKTSNMLLDRANFFMPKWSPAYQNDISTFSKIYYPVYEQLEKILTRNYNYLSANLSGTRPQYSRYSLRKPPLIITNISTDTQLAHTFNLDNSIINGASLVNVEVQGVQVNASITSITFPIVLNATSQYVFAKKTVYGSSEIFIEGLNHKRQYIQETLSISSLEFVRSNAKYTKILNITCTDTDPIISTYIDCETDFAYKPKDTLRLMVDRDKNFAASLPITVVDDLLEVFDSTGAGTSLYQYTLNIPNSTTPYSLFVTGQNDLILLQDGKLYAGVLAKPLDTIVPLQDVNNNGFIVYTEGDDCAVGKDFSFVIDFTEYLSNYVGSNFYVKLQVNDQVSYLNVDREFQNEMVDFSINKSDSKIYLDMTYEANKVYMLSLMDGQRTFSAATRADSVDFQLIYEDSYITSMYHSGANLMARDSATDSDYTIVVHKNYYELDDNNTITLPNNISNIQVIYQDFSKDNITI